MFCFHDYNNWQDVLVFNFAGTSYLLQATKCANCGKAKFRTSPARSPFSLNSCDILKKEDLVKIGFFEQEKTK
jgi:hypothetical protein